MKIPKNHTEQETMDIIDIVINRIAPKYIFNNYDIDDIKQEAFIICAEALSRYDNKRPLENFLSVNLSNRLKNLIRDNFGNSKDVNKKKVNSPATITSNIYNQYHFYELDISDLDEKEIISLIDDELPSHLREDLLKFMHDLPLTKNRRENLLKSIMSIIDENKKGR